jgi:type II secretion system (T2SS) protein E
VMPLYRTDTRIAVGIENPLSWEAMRELENWTGLKVDPAMASRSELVAAIARFYGVVPKAPMPRVEVIPAVGPYAQGTFSIHLDAIAGESPPRMRFRVEGTLTHCQPTHSFPQGTP